MKESGPHPDRWKIRRKLLSLLEAVACFFLLPGLQQTLPQGRTTGTATPAPAGALPAPLPVSLPPRPHHADRAATPRPLSPVPPRCRSPPATGCPSASIHRIPPASRG